jgi:hypothetical protein
MLLEEFFPVNTRLFFDGGTSRCFIEITAKIDPTFKQYYVVPDDVISGEEIYSDVKKTLIFNAWFAYQASKVKETKAPEAPAAPSAE